jgi:chromosome segregation ATPase
MKQFLSWINLLGIVALAVLCAAQWQRDRRLNLEVNRFEATRLAQERQIKEQTKTAQGLTDDLDHFKKQVQEAHQEATEARGKIRQLERDNLQLRSDRQQLQISVTNWAAAVAERDARMKEANGRLRDLSTQLNESVLKFNELASNHNASVLRFNELATNYNQVVTQLNQLRTGGGK